MKNKITILFLLVSGLAYGQCTLPLPCEDIKECIDSVYISQFSGGDADADPTNELQTLTGSGDVITLSDGGGSFTVTHPTVPANLDNDASNECNTNFVWNANNSNLTITDACGSRTVDMCPTFGTLTAPTITTSGPVTITATAVLETDRYVVMDINCRKKQVYEFQMRIFTTIAAGNGWPVLNVPNVGGYDRKVYDIGTYRVSGNTNNPDNPAQGAMPDAPYMGAEAHEWTNSGRIYLGQNSLRDNLSRVYVEFIVQYREN